MNRSRLSVFFTLGCFCVGSSVSGQSRGLNASRFEVHGKERTVYSGEAAAAPLWRSISASLPIDSIVPSANASVVHIGVSNLGFISNVRVWRSKAGSVDSVTAEVRQKSPEPTDYPGMAAVLKGANLESIRERIGEVIKNIALFAGAPSRGTARFPFRVELRADSLLRQTQGAVISRFLRDSVAEGRKLLVLRDSTVLTELSSVPFNERTLFSARVDERRIAGFTVGTRIYDATLQLSIAMFDTSRMWGIERRLLPDARMLNDSVIYERVRSVQLLDSVQRRLAYARELERYGVGMVIRPPLNAPQVPDVRNPRVVDSLFKRYRDTRSAEIRDSIRRVGYFAEQVGNRERLARIHLEQGDTVGALRLTTLDIATPLDQWSYNLVRPVLDDPQLAMRMGISTNELYEAFEYAFHHYPFSAPGLRAGGDSISWCPVAMCSIVAQEWTRAREPRLKNIGLMARYRMNPALYADTLIARAASGERQLATLAAQAEGRNGMIANNPGVLLPKAGGPWRDWFDWLRGTTDETIARNAAARSPNAFKPPPDSPMNDPINRLRLNSSADILRIAQLRFGVSFADTFRTKYAEAPGDTARFVYFTLLQSLGVTIPPIGNLVARLTSQSAFERSMALTEVGRLRFVAADTQVAREIGGSLVSMLLDGIPIWPKLDSTRKIYVPIGKLNSRYQVHIVADSLQTVDVERLRGAGFDVHQRAWQLPNDQSGLVVNIGAITQNGDFAIVPYSHTMLLRLANGAGGGEATGGQ